MNSTLLIAICAGLGGMLGWGFADFFAKKTIDAIGDVASLAWAHIFGTLILFVAVLYVYFFQGTAPSFPHDVKGWGFLVFFGILQAVVYLLVYKGFSKGQVAVLNPVFASFSGIAALVSIIFLGEVITGSLIFSLILLFLGVFVMNLDPSLFKGKINFLHVPGFREVAIATIFAAVWTLGWDAFIGGKDWLTYAFGMYLFMTLTILIIVKIRRVKLSGVPKKIWLLLFLIGFTETIGYVAISLGYSTTTKTSVVALLSGAFSLPTIFLARIFLKERPTSTQTFGSILIIIAIVAISLLY